MKKNIAYIILVLLAASILPMAASAYDYKVKFSWDGGTQNVDGYLFYSRQDGQDYDYMKYKWKGTAEEATLDFTCPEGQVCKTFHVIRCYVGADHSPDSNEVFHIFDGVKPSAPGEFAAAYDKITKQVTFSWTQANQDKISKWVFFYRDTDTSAAYKEIATLTASASAVSTTYDAPLDLPEKLNKVEFTAVSFNKSGVWSEDAKPVAMEINMAPPEPLNTLKINIAQIVDVHPYLQ